MPLLSVELYWFFQRIFSVFFQCLLENVLRIIWPCVSVTRKLWFQLMWSDFLAPQGWGVRSGNTKLSSRVNRITLSKQNPSSVLKGLHNSYWVRFCSGGGAGMLLRVPSSDRWIRLEVPTTAHPWPPVLFLETTLWLTHFPLFSPGFIFKLISICWMLGKKKGRGRKKKSKACLWGRQA